MTTHLDMLPLICMIIVENISQHENCTNVSESNIFFIQITLYARTSKVMKTENSICTPGFLARIQFQNVHFQQGNETNMPLMWKIGHFWVKLSTQILGWPFGHVDGWLAKTSMRAGQKL